MLSTAKLACASSSCPLEMGHAGACHELISKNGWGIGPTGELFYVSRCEKGDGECMRRKDHVGECTQPVADATPEVSRIPLPKLICKFPGGVFFRAHDGPCQTAFKIAYKEPVRYLTPRGLDAQEDMLSDEAWVEERLKQLRAEAEQSRPREFPSGATRDTDTSKPDYRGFLSPTVLEVFGAYMHRHRIQADGTLRDSDNWKKGMPVQEYLSSLLRHVIAVWAHTQNEYDRTQTGYDAGVLLDDLCGVLFNTQGMMFEVLRNHADQT